MTGDAIFNNIFLITPLLLAKVFISVLYLFHLVFSFVLLRQMRLMLNVVEADISPGILLVGFIHLTASIIGFLLVVFFL